MSHQKDLEEVRNGLSSKSPYHRAICHVGLKLIATLLRKNSDYGGSVFKRPVLAPHVSAQDAICVRMSDKVGRLTHLLASGEPAKVAESIGDSFLDLGGYIILREVEQVVNDEDVSNGGGAGLQGDRIREGFSHCG